MGLRISRKDSRQHAARGLQHGRRAVQIEHDPADITLVADVRREDLHHDRAVDPGGDGRGLFRGLDTGHVVTTGTP
jgi:hypothetical protein